MTAATTSPVELALGTVLHHAAGGATTGTLLQMVATAAQQAMGAGTSVCTVVLGDPGTGLAVHTTSASRAGAPVIVPENVLLTGPVQTTSSSGAVSTIEDARTPNARWTRWAEQARTTGVVGLRCWPVRVAGRPVGALVVLTSDPWSAHAPTGSGRSNAAGQALADVCSVVLQLPAPAHRWARVLCHLQTTLEVDVVVHQAVGMVAAAQEVDITAAAAALAAHAQRLGTEVTDVARQVVARTLPAGDVGAPRQP